MTPRERRALDLATWPREIVEGEWCFGCARPSPAYPLLHAASSRFADAPAMARLCEPCFVINGPPQERPPGASRLVVKVILPSPWRCGAEAPFSAVMQFCILEPGHYPATPHAGLGSEYVLKGFRNLAIPKWRWWNDTGWLAHPDEHPGVKL